MEDEIVKFWNCYWFELFSGGLLDWCAFLLRLDRNPFTGFSTLFGGRGWFLGWFLGFRLCPG
jgi:hypothetical protein